MATQQHEATFLDEPTMRGMQAELTADLAAFFHGDPTTSQKHRLDEWLESIQPPDTIARLAAQAAASVLVAFERGYRMSDVERQQAGELAPVETDA